MGAKVAKDDAVVFWLQVKRCLICGEEKIMEDFRVGRTIGKRCRACRNRQVKESFRKKNPGKCVNFWHDGWRQLRD